MTGSQQWVDLDALVDHLGNSGASLEQRVEALLKLDQAVQALPVDAPAGGDQVENERNLARASLIAKITRIGDLPELSVIEPWVEPATGQRLRALCGQRMSNEVAEEFVATLDGVARSAASDAEHLRNLRDEVERGRVYRDLLGDMRSLLDLLLGGDSTTKAGN
jgi:hypothetical protein